MTATATRPPQCMTALAKANDIRIKQSNFRAQIRALNHSEGMEIVAETLLEDDPPRHIAVMKLDYMLLSVRRMGDANLGKVYRRASLHRRSPNLRVRELTVSEKERIAAELRMRCAQKRVRA